LDVLRYVYDSFSKFSEFSLAYGFGARTVQGDGPACNLFSMTGDFMNPYVDDVQSLIDAYSKSLKTVKLALPVKFKEVIQAVCDIAQIEFGASKEIHSIKNYYVLTILMAGVIDDFEDALNQILRAAHLPVSVKIIKIGASQEENDSKNLQMLSEKSFAECERKYIDVLSYEFYKKQGFATQTLG
jgi:hypothetical protein